MSTFMFGGSALALDIAGRAHAALEAGDVVMLDPEASSAADGLTTRTPVVNAGVGQIAPYGVVLGSSGKSSFAVGEDILIRIIGVVNVKMNPASPSVVGELVQIAGGQTYLNPAGGAGAFVATSATVRPCGMAHTVSAAGTDNKADVYFNGLTTWG